MILRMGSALRLFSLFALRFLCYVSVSVVSSELIDSAHGGSPLGVKNW
jgi:hypothetical protein